MTSCAPFRASCVGNHVQQALARRAPESDRGRRPPYAWRGSPRGQGRPECARLLRCGQEANGKLALPDSLSDFPSDADSFTDRPRRGHGGPHSAGRRRRARYRRALTPRCLTRGPEGRQCESTLFRFERRRFRRAVGTVTNLSLRPFVSLKLRRRETPRAEVEGLKNLGTVVAWELDLHFALIRAHRQVAHRALDTSRSARDVLSFCGSGA
jgi:hypothetical protein